MPVFFAGNFITDSQVTTVLEKHPALLQSHLSKRASVQNVDMFRNHICVSTHLDGKLPLLSQFECLFAHQEVFFASDVGLVLKSGKLTATVCELIRPLRRVVVTSRT